MSVDRSSVPQPADRLSEIEARAEAATPGPWKADRYRPSQLEPGASDVEQIVLWGRRAPNLHLVGAPVCGMEARHYRATENAAFIAAARADIPWLVGQVRAPQATVATLEALSNTDHETIARSQAVASQALDRVRELEGRAGSPVVGDVAREGSDG